MTVTNAFVDSGGLWGDVPSSVGTGSINGYVPPGTVLTISTPSGVGIYRQTILSGPTAPYVVGPTDNFNTGNSPFEIIPIYLSYSPTNVGTLFFDL
ncbi:hypothetical protein H7K38_15720 [Mycobacterium alsense]|uniref:PE cleavage protein A C-terminal domain-containing protein n=1 Tax=Mycobacterium alsense TaxID=324058 RepID=A0AA42BYR3_9MYCO|nr:hypothetical protein [Mycobacterium alsense]